MQLVSSRISRCRRTCIVRICHFHNHHYADMAPIPLELSTAEINNAIILDHDLNNMYQWCALWLLLSTLQPRLHSKHRSSGVDSRHIDCHAQRQPNVHIEPPSLAQVQYASHRSQPKSTHVLPETWRLMSTLIDRSRHDHTANCWTGPLETRLWRSRLQKSKSEGYSDRRFCAFWLRIDNGISNLKGRYFLNQTYMQRGSIKSLSTYINVVKEKVRISETRFDLHPCKSIIWWTYTTAKRRMM